jgi:hypothetical protein
MEMLKLMGNTALVIRIGLFSHSFFGFPSSVFSLFSLFIYTRQASIRVLLLLVSSVSLVLSIVCLATRFVKLFRNDSDFDY